MQRRAECVLSGEQWKLQRNVRTKEEEEQKLGGDTCLA